MTSEHTELEDTLLGKTTAYPQNYSPQILYPIARDINRNKLNISGAIPFHGFDVWNAYEISWLNSYGKPMVATGIFTFPSNSPFLIESKSLKLYLNSLSDTSYSDIHKIATVIKNDLSNAAQTEVGVELLQPNQWQFPQKEKAEQFHLLDDLDVTVKYDGVDANLLALENTEVKETLYSHLLKTNCPITKQPDWATIYIQYSGKKINPQSLLKYIISFRNHNDFHEHCVERIWMDISNYCKPSELIVTAHFTRRGGLDINPCRSTYPLVKPLYERDYRQ